MICLGICYSFLILFWYFSCSCLFQTWFPRRPAWTTMFFILYLFIHGLTRILGTEMASSSSSSICLSLSFPKLVMTIFAMMMAIQLVLNGVTALPAPSALSPSVPSSGGYDYDSKFIRGQARQGTRVNDLMLFYWNWHDIISYSHSFNILSRFH